ncbi:MAG: hypothetical protein KF832_01365 [Caldilineaceae bacterium]|nr:hypothetical protein [Caldilineaceae bacterium]
MTYYLFDSRMIEQTESVHPVLGAVQKHAANPLFGEDQPWEVRFDNLYANVLCDDDGLFRCWYSPFTRDRATAETPLAQRHPGTYVERLQQARARDGNAAREMGVCYATSTDGISWTKPTLGITEFGGSRANNLVMRYAHGNGVFKDPHATDPAERYKMVLYHEETRRMLVAWSADGQHWSTPLHCPAIELPHRDDPANPIFWMGDTHNNALWVPELECYVLINRMWRREPRRRLVGRATSTDFRQWSNSAPILEGRDGNDQLYAMPIFAYGGLYLGFPTIFNATTDTVDCELAWSADTIHWQRICAGTPLIPRGPTGSYDSGCLYAAATPVVVGEQIYLYYGGSNYLHTDWRDGYFCLATLPRDRFAGLTTTDAATTGVITTTPLLYPGGELELNADARAGQIEVTLLDPNGQPLAQSQPLRGDQQQASVVWQENPSLAAWVGQPIRLRFTLQSATLFAFTF